jgi:hypothetical protein
MVDRAQDGAAKSLTVDFPRKRVLAAIFILLAVSGGMMAADLLGWLPRPELFG